MTKTVSEIMSLIQGMTHEERSRLLRLLKALYGTPAEKEEND
jgi:hypothetical protein